MLNKIKFVIIIFLSAATIIACDGNNSITVGSHSIQTSNEINLPISPQLLANPIKFYESSLPQYVSSVSGLAAQESFGRWSNSKLVLINFNGVLPDEFDLELVLGGFGPNVGARLEVIIGSDMKALKIESDLMDMRTYRLHFFNRNKANSIALVVPHPASPQALGKAANDPRMLGIALQSLIIRPI